MPNIELEFRLRSLVRRYGYQRVHQYLHEIGLSTTQPAHSNQQRPLTNVEKAPRPASRRAKVMAVEYASRLDLPPEKKRVVVELAERFEDKLFLPTFGDIANFCGIYGIDTPTSRSRASAIPRVFRLIAAMETDKIQRILDSGMFSGPSRLGPISDAIRRNARNSAAYSNKTRPEVL